ncbi:glycosyltransferase [uncultured Olegusella sp.]|uniref:glycosyltransferase n=1 Tax=uncultured Olegusella sp. TaxID=1979846 RepID=UPI002619596B|nr:glycosyltransferase [uncultured Olegusella sp.]
MVDTPTLSVILPIYNVERFLEQCLASVAQQSFNDIQVICIDDGSTDSSSQIIDSFVRKDPRFEAIHKQNGGYGKAVNVGLSYAKGEYISIIEPDDYIDMHMFEKLITAARKTNFPDVVKAAYWRVIDANTSHEHMQPAAYYHSTIKPLTRFTLAENAKFLFHHPSIWSAVYRRGFLEEKNIRMHEIPGAGWADNPWFIETLAQAASIVYVDECLYYYREFNAGSSSVVKDPAIIYNRWFDMDDIIQRLKITAPRILEGHYSRCCTYIQLLNENFDVADPEIKKAIGGMVSRVNGICIVRSSRIKAKYRRAYLMYAPVVVIIYSWLYNKTRRIKRRILH